MSDADDATQPPAAAARPDGRAGLGRVRRDLWPAVHRLARRRGLQDADAADLVQDVFRAVAGAIERYDPDPAKGSFRGWLSTIARNLIVNLLDAQRRHPHGTGDSEVRRLLEEQPAPDSQQSADLRRRVPPPRPRLGRRTRPRRVHRGDLAGLLEDRRRGPVRPGSGAGAGPLRRHRLPVQEPGRRPHPARGRTSRERPVN